MASDISLEDVHRELGQVMHPAINRSLVELGMIKDIALEHGVVKLTLALPVLNIPASIKYYLANSIRTAVTKLGVEVEVETTEMNEEERYNFLAMEQENWKGPA